MIEDTYVQGDSIIKALNNKELNIKYEDVCKMLNDLYTITEDMQKYYDTSIGDVTKIDKSTEITKNINEFENIYQYYKEDDLEYLINIETTVKNIKAGITDENTNINNYKMLSSYYLSNWSNLLMKKFDNDYFEKVSTNIEYSKLELTNQDVIVKIISNGDMQVINNFGNKEHTFRANGEFVFEYTIKGRNFEKKATVNNIDKTPPVISGIEDNGFYTDSVTPKITDANLQDVKIYKDNNYITSYNTNSPISDDGTYTLEATDKAGNKTIITFDICSIPATINYSETNWTNKNVVATIVSNYPIKVTNNSGENTYTFNNNGTFTFDYTIKGKSYTATATVNNIDKIPPKILNVENGKLYVDKAIIPNVSDENLNEIKLYINSIQVKDYKSGNKITEEGFYRLVANDLAGNETEVKFNIMKNNSEEYKIQGKNIFNIAYNTSKKDFMKKFSNSSGYQIERNGQVLGDEENIATGDKLKTKAGDEYSLIVTGDINKDGKVNISDVIKLRRYLLLRNNLDEQELLAADCNLDGKSINISDLIKLRLIVLGKGTN